MFCMPSSTPLHLCQECLLSTRIESCGTFLRLNNLVRPLFYRLAPSSSDIQVECLYALLPSTCVSRVSAVNLDKVMRDIS